MRPQDLALARLPDSISARFSASLARLIGGERTTRAGGNVNRLDFDFATSGRATSGGASSQYFLHCWGDFALSAADGSNVTPRGRKARALVAWLAMHPDRPASRERLAGLLWGDRGEEQARASLRQVLFELRPLSEGPEPLIGIDRASIVLHGHRLRSDFADPPPEDELLFANLDDMDDGFDDWLRIARARPPDPPPKPPAPTETLVPAVSPSPPSARPRWLFAALAAALLLALAVIFVAPRFLGSSLPGGRPAEAVSAIAVLPFRAAPGGDDARAQSLADDVRLHLGRNPRAQVLGRFSSSLPGSAQSPAETGRSIGASHVVSGTVSSGKDGIGVDAALTRSADGALLWRHRYEATPDQLFDVQRAIGTAIERELRLGAESSPARPPRGDVYALLLTARELAAAQEPARMAAAEQILRRAVALDPTDGRAHAALARALFWRLPVAPATPGERHERAEASDHAEAALRLAPDIADSHMAMAEATSSFADPRAGLAHLQAAVRLDPGLADTWLSIALAHERLGDYAQALQAARQAVRLEPYWWPAFYFSAEMAWNLGHRAESIKIVNRVAAHNDPFQSQMVRGDLAWRQGDFANEVTIGTRALALANEGQRRFAHLTIGRALRAAGLNEQARQIWPFYTVTDDVANAWNGIAPTPAQFAALTASPDRFWSGHPIRQLMFRTLVNSGRTAEIVAFLDRTRDTPASLRTRHFAVAGFICSVPPLVQALRAEGRPREAAELLAFARRDMDRLLAGREIPARLFYLDSELAMLEGHPDAAIARLEQAAARGWLYAREDMLPDLGDEPAFRPLAGNPRFDAIRAAQSAHVARERTKILANSVPARTN